jgi:hypothetical protein
MKKMGMHSLTLRLAATAVAILAGVALAVALWPESAADRAYDDGHRLGAAVVQLQNADTPDEVDNALFDVRDAAGTAVDHADDELSAQIDRQSDALYRVAEGFVGENTTTDGWDQAVYDAELDQAVTDLESQASDFRDAAPDVTQAFYDGLQDGLGV